MKGGIKAELAKIIAGLAILGGLIAAIAYPFYLAQDWSDKTVACTEQLGTVRGQYGACKTDLWTSESILATWEAQRAVAEQAAIDARARASKAARDYQAATQARREALANTPDKSPQDLNNWMVGFP